MSRTFRSEVSGYPPVCQTDGRTVCRSGNSWPASLMLFGVPPNDMPIMCSVGLAGPKAPASLVK